MIWTRLLKLGAFEDDRLPYDEARLIDGWVRTHPELRDAPELLAALVNLTEAERREAKAAAICGVLDAAYERLDRGMYFAEYKRMQVGS